jgi:type IV pilus assembly protein PilP
VVWNTKNPRALVSDPEGRSFVLRRGSPIGKNNGRVIRIADDVILVQEKFVDFEGTVSTKDVEMRIRKSQGG